MIDARLSIRQFWQRRNLETHLLLDRYTVHNVSIFFAYAAYRLKLTPNHLSAASGAFSALALIAAAFTPANDLVVPILAIYALSQISYLFDCADGQLARATETASTYGAFLDKAMDLASVKLQYGAFFIFLYRYYMAEGHSIEAQSWLFGGLAFIFFKLARFVVSQFFANMMPDVYENSKSNPTSIFELIKNFMDHQVSLLNMLVFLLSPLACMLIYLAQTTLLSIAWVRYFRRGYH